MGSHGVSRANATTNAPIVKDLASVAQIYCSEYSFFILEYSLNMNKADLAAAIASSLGLHKKQAEDMVDALQSAVTNALARQEEVTIAGFGTFSARVRSARMGVNPRNPSERIRVPEVLVPKFKAGKALKDALKAAYRIGGSSAPSAPPAVEPTSSNSPSAF